MDRISQTSKRIWEQAIDIKDRAQELKIAQRMGDVHERRSRLIKAVNAVREGHGGGHQVVCSAVMSGRDRCSWLADEMGKGRIERFWNEYGILKCLDFEDVCGQWA